MLRPLRPAWACAAILCSATALAQARPRVRVDDEKLKQLVERAMPAVERAAGRRFVRTPTALLADAGDVSRALADDLAPQMRAFYRGQPESRVDRVIRRYAALYASSLLGKYAFAAKELYVMPHLVDPMLDLHGIDRGLGDDVLLLVVAHELVHALQDQHVGLVEKVRETLDQDAVHGLSAVLEGHAVFCSELAAAELGIERAIPALRKMFRGELATPAGHETTLARRSLRFAPEASYLRGAEFAAHHHRAGGAEKLWQILAAPAPSSAMIFAPESWAAEWPAREDLGAALAGLELRLGKGQWTVGRGSAGELLLRSENLPAMPALEAVLPHLRGGAFLEAEGATPMVRAMVLLLAFASAAPAATFLEVAESAARADAEALQKEAAGREARCEFAAAPALEGTTGRRFTQVPPPEFSAVARGELLWYCRGRHVLQITLLGHTMDDAQLVELARAVFASLPQ